MVIRNFARYLYALINGNSNVDMETESGAVYNFSASAVTTYLNNFASNSGVFFRIGTDSRKTVFEDKSLYSAISSGYTSGAKSAVNGDGIRTLTQTFMATTDLVINEVGLSFNVGTRSFCIVRISTSDTDESGNAVFTQIKVNAGDTFTISMVIG